MQINILMRLVSYAKSKAAPYQRTFLPFSFACCFAFVLFLCLSIAHFWYSSSQFKLASLPSLHTEAQACQCYIAA